MGVFVKRDTTSCEIKHSSSFIVTSPISSECCFELSTCWLVAPTKGLMISASDFLVHPKTREIPYKLPKPSEVPCKGCSKTYIGETGHLLKTRLAEHKAEADKISAKSFTRSQRKASTTETFKSAIAEHVAATNHVIGWEEAKLIDQEQDKTTRWIKETIWIRNRGKNIMN